MSESVLEGRSVAFESVDEIRRTVEEAFDYRGDITIEREGAGPIVGYIFDRHFAGDDVGSWTVRMLTDGSKEKLSVPVASIRRLTFSGKDTAHGKSFEKWMEKYKAKKQAEAAARVAPTPGGGTGPASASSPPA